ncbi:MAG: ATP-binding protein [Puniceicoccales bacterium]|jgi:hypothetical protein|nr:ATP-binding protein [Puniceicoccales bacterium]
MDTLTNPFSPGAGTPPPELAGRQQILDDARVLLARVKAGRSEKSLVLTGLRGVGKTVLLNTVASMAEADGYRTVMIEVTEKSSLGTLLTPHLSELLCELDRMAGVSAKVRRALSVLRSFVGGLKITVGEVGVGVDVEPLRGTADSGDLSIDLTKLFQAVGEAALDKGAGAAIFIDELQYLSQDEFGALIMAIHRMQQLRLPVVFVGAGLPTLPGLAGASKTYAERLFNFPQLGALSAEDSAKAIQEPAAAAGVAVGKNALREIYRKTCGYPYFLQEWGYQAWNFASGKTITLDAVSRASARVVERLDQSFFRVRFDRLTTGEKNFLRAMADADTAPLRTGVVAEKLGVPLGRLGPVRASLIKKSMIYSPAYGELAYTVPLFGEFMRRAIPE